MLKGKSTIQLFNAKTGKLEHEQKNTNIVTNAVADIINDNDPLGLGKMIQCRSGSSNSYEYHKPLLRRNYITPLTTIAFGGVLLWDNTISEDPTITMPPNGVNEVGHAGNTYSGANTFRGSYNTNESGSLENGYRHVWDFGTDKANGTIKALSLTSQYGGMCGYRNDSGGDNETYAPYTYYHFGADTTFKAFEINLDNVGYSGCDDGPFLYIAQNSDGGFYGIKRSTTDFTKIQQVTFAKPGILTLEGIKDITEVKDLIAGINQYAQTYVHDNKIHEVYLSSTTELVHKTYSLEGALLNTVNVTLPTAAVSSKTLRAYAFYYNGYYYYYSSSASGVITYKKTNATGEDLGEAFTIPPYSGTTAHSVNIFFVDNNGNGVLRVGSNSTNAASYSNTDYYIYPDGKTCLSLTNSFSISNAVYSCFCPAVTPIKTPFVYISAGNYQARLLLGVDCRCLATINNLSTPVTKTSAQVMKVTYEITEG